MTLCASSGTMVSQEKRLSDKLVIYAAREGACVCGDYGCVLPVFNPAPSYPSCFPCGGVN